MTTTNFHEFDVEYATKPVRDAAHAYQQAIYRSDFPEEPEGVRSRFEVLEELDGIVRRPDKVGDSRMLVRVSDSAWIHEDLVNVFRLTGAIRVCSREEVEGELWFHVFEFSGSGAEEEPPGDFVDEHIKVHRRWDYLPKDLRKHRCSERDVLGWLSERARTGTLPKPKRYTEPADGPWYPGDPDPDPDYPPLDNVVEDDDD